MKAIKWQGRVLKTVHCVRMSAYRLGDRADILVITIMSIVNNIVNNITVKTRLAPYSRRTLAVSFPRQLANR